MFKLQSRPVALLILTVRARLRISLYTHTHTHTHVFVPVKVNKEPVEVVFNFKYFGTLIDNKLSFSDNTNLIYNKYHNNSSTSCPSRYLLILVMNCYKLCTQV